MSGAAPSPLSQDEIRRRAAELGDWFQNLNLRGVQTAPHHFLGDYPTCKWRQFENAIPADLTGKTVLDIGCNAGFYALRMVRRGAGRVVGGDSVPGYLAQARFAADVIGADIEFRQLDVYKIAALREKFDLVLFMGVLYHLRHPLLALDLLHEHVVKDTMVFQALLRGCKQVAPILSDYPFSETDVFDWPGYPVMHFVEHRYAGDGNNWWIP